MLIYSIQYQDEGFGTPEHVYIYNGIEIVVKNSALGTCYLDSCKDCNKFPCQLGIVSMVLSQDGLLKVCSLNDKIYVDVRPLIDDNENTRKEVKKLVDVYNSAKFFERKWKG